MGAGGFIRGIPKVRVLWYKGGTMVVQGQHEANASGRGEAEEAEFIPCAYSASRAVGTAHAIYFTFRPSSRTLRPHHES